MRRLTAATFALSAAAALLLGCDSSRSLEPLSASDEAAEAKGRVAAFATLTKLPDLGSNSEAHAIDASGTVVVGHSFDQAGYRYAVKWTFQNGSWVISTLQGPGLAAYTAEGVSDAGTVAGYFGSSPTRAVQWSPAGAIADLGCLTDVARTTAYAISGNGQTVAGGDGPGGSIGASVWPAAGGCRIPLPTLGAGAGPARAVNGDGTIVGGSAALSLDVFVPVRWSLVEGQWTIQQLDIRNGGVRGGNAQGDLVGSVSDPCTQRLGCTHAVVWYAGDPTPFDLGTLNSDRNAATDINSAGEVVGINATYDGRSTAFIWSAALGVRLLPDKVTDAGAWAVSEVRADGTRVVAGFVNTQAAVWVVR